MKIDFFQSNKRDSHREVRMSRMVKPTKDYLNFGHDYFDNPRLGVGYGSYVYDHRHEGAVGKMIEHYGLKKGDKVLELGCAKGFVLVEFLRRGMQVRGIDKSRYAVRNTHLDVGPFITVGDAGVIPNVSNSFDFVLCKEMLPHIPLHHLKQAIDEMIRVVRDPTKMFFEIQCGRTQEEKEKMQEWDVTHRIIQAPIWWDMALALSGYEGDVNYKVLFPS